MTARTLLVLLLLPIAWPALARPAPAGAPSAFDYYVLSLSWSPRYCTSAAGARDHGQCGSDRHHAFVLHGLWPQYEQGSPQSCAGTRKLPPALVERMLDIMPSPKLVRREWETHGTCSGLDPETYFAKARAAYGAVRIPETYRAPQRALRVNLRQLEQDFVRANPHLTPDDIAVLCENRFLQEVRICLDRNLFPRACGRDVRDQCRGDEVIVPPVR